jgi:hypothetical protein
MSEIAVIGGAAEMFVAAFVAWYALWRRRVATALRRVPVGTARTVPVVRRRADLPGNSR